MTKNRRQLKIIREYADSRYFIPPYIWPNGYFERRVFENLGVKQVIGTCLQYPDESPIDILEGFIEYMEIHLSSPTISDKAAMIFTAEKEAVEDLLSLIKEK